MRKGEGDMNAYDLMSPPYDLNICHDCSEESMVINVFLRPWMVVNSYVLVMSLSRRPEEKFTHCDFPQLHSIVIQMTNIAEIGMACFGI